MTEGPETQTKATGLDPVLLATPFEVQTTWHVITGAQSCGKTTLIELLRERGFRTEAETARQYFEMEFGRGRSLEEIMRDPGAVQRAIVSRQLALERRLQPDQVEFLDRAVPDCLTFLRFFGQDPNEILPFCRERRYASVFVLDRLPIATDGLRIEDEELAAYQDEWLPTDYGALGYKVIRVPVLRPEERVAFVLEQLGEQGRSGSRPSC